MDLHGKTIVVTGGAMGIGAATVRRLATEGARVIIVDCDDKAAEETVRQVSESGGLVEFQHTDLADPNSIAGMGKEVLQKTESLHGLVNNAGISRRAPIEKDGFVPAEAIDDETSVRPWVATGAEWEPVISVNLRAPLLCAQALLPALKRGPGHIVNISSIGAFRPRPYESVYDATKAGICALTRVMACEFARYGMRVNSVAPGWIVTPMHFGTGPEADERKAWMEEYVFEGAVLRRPGRPHEVAAAIAFLLSEEASYITASTIHVDGGVVAN